MAQAQAIADIATPKFDAETMAAVQQRNLEALTAFSVRLATGAQTLMRRQSELMQGHLTGQLAAAKDMFANSSTQAGLTKQLAFAQAQAKQALADTEELAGIVSATASEALDILYKHTQSVSEIYSNDGNGSARLAVAPGRPSAKAR